MIRWKRTSEMPDFSLFRFFLFPGNDKGQFQLLGLLFDRSFLDTLLSCILRPLDILLVLSLLGPGLLVTGLLGLPGPHGGHPAEVLVRQIQWGDNAVKTIFQSKDHSLVLVALGQNDGQVDLIIGLRLQLRHINATKDAQEDLLDLEEKSIYSEHIIF